MADFNLSRSYGLRASDRNNRKMSRSDLVFQKLKKYEEKYKTNRNSISLQLNRGLVKTDSDSDTEQYGPVTPQYTGPRGTQEDLITNQETSKPSLQEVETLATIKSLENCNITSSGERPVVVENNKSLIIDLKVDNVDFVDSYDSQTGLTANSFTSVCQDKPEKSDAELSLKHDTTTFLLKASVNNNVVEYDTINHLNTLHRNMMLQDCHKDPDSNHMYSSSITTDNELLTFNNNMNESKEVELSLIDKMKEVQQPSRPPQNSLKQNKEESLKQINSDPLSNRKKPHEELESIRTEIFQNNSDVTSYEVPDISNSFDMDIKEKAESSHLDIVVTSESSVSSGGDVPQNTDDKSVPVSASDTAKDVTSSCAKSNKIIRKELKPQTDVNYHYCKTKSTQTNINVNFLHQMNDTQLPNTIAEEDLLLSPYSLFVYHYLLHGYPQDHIKKNNDWAVNFLNKCLLEQVNITQHLIKSHQATYNSYCTAARNLSKNYQPITLENTMQIIKQSKKKERSKLVSP